MLPGNLKITNNYDGFLVEWEPGNGTRYMAFFAPIEEEASKRIGCGNGCWMTSLWTYTSESAVSSYPLGGGGIAHLTYVAKKFGLREGEDLRYWTALVNEMIPSYDSDYAYEILRNPPHPENSVLQQV